MAKATTGWSWKDYQKLAAKSAPEPVQPDPVPVPEPEPEPEPEPVPVQDQPKKVRARRAPNVEVAKPVSEAKKPRVPRPPKQASAEVVEPVAEAKKGRTRRIETSSTIDVKSVDKHIGGRIREARTLAGVSQADLGEFIGVTFQQVQKYERGANRIGPGRLAKIGEKLGFPMAWFYEGIPQPGSNSMPQLEARAVKIARLLEGVPDDVIDNVLGLLKALSKE